VTLHEELRELVDSFGADVFRDGDEFRAALDDFLREDVAIPGQLNVLYDAVRFGAYARFVELAGQGGDPVLAVRTAGDALARERGTTEVVTSRWAVATLAHAAGHLETSSLAVFLQPDTAGGPAPTAPPPPPPDVVPATAQPPASGQRRDLRTAPAPLPLPPAHPPPATRRRGIRVAALAAGSVALVAAGGYAVMAIADQDDSGERGSTTGDTPSSTPPTTSPSTGSSAGSVPALEPPGAPDLDATAAYLSVSFTISGPLTAANGIDLEMRTADGWADTPTSFQMPTRQGGEQACAQVRAVRVDGDRREAGAPVRECGTSQPRTVEWARSSTGCPTAGGVACYTYDLSVAGFRPDEDVTMEIVGGTDPRTGVFYNCVEKCVKKVSVDGDGRGGLEDALRAYAGSSNVVEVDGLRSRFRADG
jgi:hypothetical protein